MRLLYEFWQRNGESSFVFRLADQCYFTVVKVNYALCDGKAETVAFRCLLGRSGRVGAVKTIENMLGIAFADALACIANAEFNEFSRLLYSYLYLALWRAVAQRVVDEYHAHVAEHTFIALRKPALLCGGEFYTLFGIKQFYHPGGFFG